MRVLATGYESKQAQLDLFQSEKARLEEDLDVPLQLRQGQLEVEPQGIVDGNLDLAVLIPESLVRVSCHACSLYMLYCQGYVPKLRKVQLSMVTGKFHGSVEWDLDHAWFQNTCLSEIGCCCACI